MDHSLWGDRSSKAGSLPRSQRWPKQVPAKRKFDGKWYTLEHVDRDRVAAEEYAQDWRGGWDDPVKGKIAYYARVVPFDDWGLKGEIQYLVYMRPKPLSPEDRARNRKMRDAVNYP